MENITNPTPVTPDDYYVRNEETGKLELHFTKATYQALDDDAKKRIKSNFLWGRSSGCWISRCKFPNLGYAIRVAEELGLEDAGKTGERLSFADQMQRKAERAERRAERYEGRSEAAEKRGEALQAPINAMHGDIAFFTQPNISTSAGRAFTNRRNRMWASWENGLEEFRKSAYWQDRASAARRSAGQPELRDKAFVTRRIKERESDIRKLQKSVEAYEGYLASLERGETPRNQYGWEVSITRESCEHEIERWLDMLEAKLDELGFYQDCLADLGGVAFGPDNIKPGYVVKINRGRTVVTVTSAGPQNFRYTDASITLADGSPWPGQASYAEIAEIVKAAEAAPETHPFKVGDQFTCPRWNRSLGNHGSFEDATFTIIRATDKSVTLQTGSEKPFIRKPAKSQWRKGEWHITVTDSYKGIWTKRAEA